MQKVTEIIIKEKQDTKVLLIQFFANIVPHQLLQLLDNPYGIIAFKIDIYTIVEDFAGYC